MVTREIAIIRAPEGLEPLPSCQLNRTSYETLYAAIRAALDTPSGPTDRPWLRAGIGDGSAIFNLQGILLLEAAYHEGQSSA